uniref:Uncharacterized protein n=1 Tax=Oryza brachyantha TaxID=4533 RepID=J3ML55_ORYBR
MGCGAEDNSLSCVHEGWWHLRCAEGSNQQGLLGIECVPLHLRYMKDGDGSRQAVLRCMTSDNMDDQQPMLELELVHECMTQIVRMREHASQFDSATDKMNSKTSRSAIEPIGN